MSKLNRRGVCRRLAATAFAVILSALPALAQHAGHGQAASTPPIQSTPIKAGDLVIATAWTRQPPDGARVAGGFMKITNNGKISDRLIGGSAPFAKRFEVHEMTVVDGVMKMRELAKGLEIKPGETVELKPGGYHIMYMDITEAPKAGATVKATLKFEKAGEVAIDMPVVAVGGGSGQQKKMHH